MEDEIQLFIKFIDERIEMASSIQTKSAYIIVKEVFLKLFVKSK